MVQTFDRYCLYIFIKLYLRQSLSLFDEDVIVVGIILLFNLIESQFQNITSVSVFISFFLAGYEQDFPSHLINID